MDGLLLFSKDIDDRVKKIFFNLKFSSPYIVCVSSNFFFSLFVSFAFW